MLVAWVYPAETSVECHASGRRGKHDGEWFWWEYDD